MKGIGNKLKMLSLALVVLTGNAWAQQPGAQPPRTQTKVATVTLRKTADLLGTDVRLGDVAVVESHFAPLVERLHGLRVAGRPRAGRDRRIERLEIERLLESEGVPSAVVDWSGAPACRAVARTTTLDSDSVFDVAAPIAEASLRSLGVDRFRLEPVGSKFTKPLAPGRTGRRLHGRVVPGHHGSPYLHVDVDVLIDGEVAETLRVQFEVFKQVQVVTPVRLVRRGEPLAGLVELQTIEVRNGREADWMSEAAIGGLVATRDLRAGQPLQRADGRMPFVVGRNRAVKVTSNRGRVSLTFMAVALRDAGVGDQVRVRKPDGSFLETWVTGPAAVSMTPPEVKR